MPRVHKRHSLKELMNRHVLFTQALALIHKNASYRTIHTFLHRKNFDISLGSIGHLVKKDKYSKKYGIPIEKLIDKRAYAQHQKNIKDVAKSGRLQLDGLDANTRQVVKSSINYAKKANVHILPRNDYVNTQLVLDKLINELNDELDAHNVEPPVRNSGLRAIEDKEKFTGNGALSLDAVKQYKLINDAKFKALAEVATSMFDKKTLKEFGDRVSKAQQAIVQNLGISEDGKRLYAAYEKSGLRV